MIKTNIKKREIKRRISFLFIHYRVFLFCEAASRLPMTPQETLKFYGTRLTEFERAEIGKYSEIWYLGLSAHKIHGEEGSSQNCGYDDEDGNYNKVLHDHISYRCVFPFSFLSVAVVLTFCCKLSF